MSQKFGVLIKNKRTCLPNGFTTGILVKTFTCSSAIITLFNFVPKHNLYMPMEWKTNLSIMKFPTTRAEFNACEFKVPILLACLSVICSSFSASCSGGALGEGFSPLCDSVGFIRAMFREEKWSVFVKYIYQLSSESRWQFLWSILIAGPDESPLILFNDLENNK